MTARVKRLSSQPPPGSPSRTHSKRRAAPIEIRRAESPTKWLWFLAGVGCILVDALLWAGGVQGSSPGRWIALPFAVFFIFPFIFCLAMGPQWGVPVTDRTRELDVVWQEMKARADRGEIPLTTPGGPKVWQEQ